MTSVRLPRADLRPAPELAADKPHGTRIKYMAGCKCLRCRAANSNYETERAKLRKLGLGNPVVSARRALNHIERLRQQAAGATKSAIARALGRRTPNLQLRRDRVLKRNAVAIKKLHDQTWFRFEAMRRACRCSPAPIESDDAQ